MLEKHIKVSVIVPVYNLEKYISRCLNSIRNQTLENIEIIVINDGSKDQSLKVIEDHMKEDKRIKCISQKNSGVSSARNKGITMAVGNYITFVDGDDCIDSNMLNNMIISSEINNTELAFSHFSNIENNVENSIYLSTSEQYIKDMIEGTAPRTACGILIKSELIRNHSLNFDIDMVYGEDMLFSIKLLLLTKKNIVIDSSIYYLVEERPGSAIRTMNPDQYIHVQLLAKRLDEVFQKESIIYKYQSLLQKFYFYNLLFSISHVVKSKISFIEKLNKIRDIKKSSHGKSTLCIEFDSTLTIKFKALLIKYAPAPLTIFVWLLNNRVKGV